ncbi:MAG: bifunctional 4-hydroxy-2-oxoglutarate aldolase/2-dehydro-3-deoxy-phosphogluconate aldolase [Clostridia bacterium]|nr:bifunctional 4-hydroxy-2-oxoglutarate aldolase/2-dehydro-3-deoxy-phosphogluconate aldolase [Clostridia bacterium]
MNGVIDLIGNAGVLPVIALDSEEKAVPLAKALYSGGLPAIEVTLRTDCALNCIKRISEEYPETVVGAGTVLTVSQADEAVRAGAKFIVTPGFDETIARHCLDRGYLLMPGVSGVADVQKAYVMGFRTVKLFPCEPLGGLDYIKQVSGPFRGMRFVATGGITFDNVQSYLENGSVRAVGGSFIIPKKLLSEGRFSEISREVRASMAKILGFKLMHVGIHCENEQDAFRTAEWFSGLFGFCVADGQTVFSGTAVECMKAPYLGKKYHIGFRTVSAERAKFFFENMGIGTREYKYDGNGKMFSFYLDCVMKDFAVHVTYKPEEKS